MFHDAFYKFATTKFKTKSRLKEIKHEFVRSSYFAVENITEKGKENVNTQLIYSILYCTYT
jgi:hypothetical protein